MLQTGTLVLTSHIAAGGGMTVVALLLAGFGQIVYALAVIAEQTVSAR